MGILDIISDDKEWQSFYNYKIEKGHLTKKEQSELESFINEKRYLDISSKIKGKDFNFSVPIKKVINKIGSDKKRIVYYYNEEENMILKFITYHLFKYDNKMSDNCYSFRKNFGVKKAIDKIVGNKNIRNMYCYKVDIKNYFNSIDVDELIVVLKEVIDDDCLLEFFIKLLTLDKANFENEIVVEKRGAMAGVPFSPFLANIYLKDLDAHFEKNAVLYARYSDDIIVFADTIEELNVYIKYIKEFVNKKKLEINQKKEYLFEKGEAWNFLGVKYVDGKMDLSDITIDKIKGKIRRKARTLHRWKNRKGASCDRAIKAMIRSFNKKFFDADDANDLTWSRWFFPLINCDGGLKIVDKYFQYYLRYIATGKHNKANYRIKYDELKKYNYRSLVNEYYKFKRKEFDE
jgi:retron-type reverse transcriptase